MDLPISPLLLTIAAFALGAVAARAGGALLDARRLRRRMRERVGSWEGGLTGSTSQFLRLTRQLEEQVAEFERAVADRDVQLGEFRAAYEQRARELDALRGDVRDAVAKTRELREELIDRASDAAREHARLVKLESELRAREH